MEKNFADELKSKWNYGGMHIKLIFINVAVYLLINILLVLGHLFSAPGSENGLESILNSIFSLQGSWKGIISHPWGLFTSIFSHFGFMHLLFNMVFLYFIGQFFLMYFSNQRMLYTYLLGGIAGGLLQVFAYTVFPRYAGAEILVVGASGAVNAVFFAAALYRPMAVVRLFGRFSVKMIYIAMAFLFMDLIQMGGADNVAHFAHLGGALFGYWSIQKIDSKSNIINRSQRMVSNLKASFRGEQKLKVKQGGKNKKKPASQQTDEAYNRQKHIHQEEINVILDKIAKSGYDSLTKREKQILFDQSQR